VRQAENQNPSMSSGDSGQTGRTAGPIAKQALSQLSYGPRTLDLRAGGADGRLLVEVEVPWRALLKPEPLLLGSVA